jgi:hypothetical protein
LCQSRISLWSFKDLIIYNILFLCTPVCYYLVTLLLYNLD